MEYLILGLFGFFLSVFSVILFKVIGRLTETNKQLMILVAGKEPKPESALRALVTASKPPKKNIPGIADDKKKDKGPKNSNYTMEIGVS